MAEPDRMPEFACSIALDDWPDPRQDEPIVIGPFPDEKSRAHRRLRLVAEVAGGVLAIQRSGMLSPVSRGERLTSLLTTQGVVRAVRDRIVRIAAEEVPPAWEQSGGDSQTPEAYAATLWHMNQTLIYRGEPARLIRHGSNGSAALLQREVGYVDGWQGFAAFVRGDELTALDRATPLLLPGDMRVGHTYTQTHPNRPGTLHRERIAGAVIILDNELLPLAQQA